LPPISPHNSVGRVVSKPTDIASQRAKQLKLSAPVQAALNGIQAELAEAYRESFTEMVHAIQEQASALNRIQNTLNLLFQRLAPDFADQAPPVVRVAKADEKADLASAVVVADPIGQGFTLSLANLAKAIGVSPTDLGTLVKALKLNNRPGFSVVVRSGPHSAIANYHVRAIEEFRRIIRETSASTLTDKNERSALERLKKRLQSVTLGQAL
jgi:hypothetical protein